MDAYLEIGKKRAFAAALEWPGWCRAARDEHAALQALIDYGARYGRVTREFQPPADAAELAIVERLEGDATTDFGAPGAIPAADQAPLQEADLQRQVSVLTDCWSAFEAAVEKARGRQLATGPRGGGRSLEAIVDHVHGAHGSYSRQLGGKEDFEAALLARWRGEVPDVGPRGGSRWPPRYAIRRAAWHILDHAWEIEDRAED